MKYSLSDICEYVKDKIDVGLLNKMTYISTENMLPNRGGLKPAVALPDTKTTRAFCKGDVLVSNIRPYFKKIWFATFDGGCSNDILVFRARDGINKQFLYYILANDNFFKYSMATSKGTKMPRGDKKAIMEYGVPVYSAREQEKLVSILNSIDQKIQINNKINENLAEQIKEICTRCFSDRSLFNRVLPNDWSKTTLAAVANFISGYSYKGNELADSNVAMATIKNFDRKRGFKLDGYKEIVPSGKLKETQHVELFDTLVAHTDLTQNAAVIGNAELVISKSNYDDIIFSMDLVKVIPKEKRISKFLIAAILQDERFKTHCLGYINGTTVLHLSKKALPEYPIYLPNDLSALIPLDKIFTNLYQQIAINIEENLNLQILRDILLIKLMSETRDILR